MSTTTTAYSTNHLALTAWLIASKSVELIEVLPPGERRDVTFVLTQPDPEEVTAFHNGSGMVSARNYSSVLKRLKGEIYEARRRVAQ